MKPVLDEIVSCFGRNGLGCKCFWMFFFFFAIWMKVYLTRRTAQNFALFSPPPATIFILLSLSWGPFVEFCWCLELDMFLTAEILEDTPAVLSLGKFCEDHGYSDEWINGQTPHLIKKRYSDTVQHREHRSDRGSWFVNEFFLQFVLFNNHDTFKAGN